MCEMYEPCVTIIVATHKKYQMPMDGMYLPLHVGAEGKTDAEGNPLDFGYAKDNMGENISILNPSFCELTGLYWAWKNLDADYIGLVHYRRLFEMNGETLTYDRLKVYLGKIKIFIPQKRKYVIETLESHYNHTHCPEHLVITEAVLMEKYPEYEQAYKKAINKTWGYMFNMMIMEKGMLNDYCTWLFDILFEIFERIDSSNYSAFAKRYIGRISEILFNAWLGQQLENKKIKKNQIKELKCNVEENWLVKIPAFLQAKFWGKRYEKSF